MKLTDRINRIQISPTAAVITAAEQLKAKGVDIADFGPGEPDFATPDHIKQAAIQAIHDNKTKYTPTGGIMPARSLRATRSSFWAYGATFAKSTSSNVNRSEESRPVALALVLWQGTQYLSTSARSSAAVWPG